FMNRHVAASVYPDGDVLRFHLGEEFHTFAKYGVAALYGKQHNHCRKQDFAGMAQCTSQKAYVSASGSVQTLQGITVTGRRRWHLLCGSTFPRLTESSTKNGNKYQCHQQGSRKCGQQGNG